MNENRSTMWRARASALALTGTLLLAGAGPWALPTVSAKPRSSASLIQQFANATPIAITDNRTSTPSTITVSGLDTPIADINVSLNVYSHTQPADVDVLLVGPQGQTALIMSDVAAASRAENDSLLLDDQAGPQLPSQDDLTSGPFQPTNYDFSSQPDSFAPDPRIPSPLPSGSALAVFNGTNANGTWTLFVDDADDDTPDSSGSIAAGWSLTITTANGVPRTGADSFATQAGKTLTIPAAGVLANDTDPDGDALTAILAGEPGRGTVTLAPDGSFSYRANRKAKGTDTFTYLAQDATGLTALETVTIQIKGKKKHKR
ncbi:MAG: cadherin-like domain-containing protein, partial [Thermomicrobiales bacterium]|nr:cadherin-like domain-containing protein [Thermomicrobiales bacterium]